MRKIAIVACAALLTLGSAFSAFADTGSGSKIDGPVVQELDFTSETLAPMDVYHSEFAYNPDNTVFKGWWSANLMNSTNTPWGSMTISAGATDLVAIVQGQGLTDEWDYTGNSVTSYRPAYTPVYSGSLGTRDYGNGVVGQLWKSVTFNFVNPVLKGQKVKFLVYTDNSYYALQTGNYADHFSLTLTPSPTPEPAGFIALLSGGVALAGLLRRRK